MRVALLTTFGETCGIATYSEALIGALPDQGIEPSVLSPRLRPGDSPRGPQHPRIWRRDRATLWQAVQTFRALRKARAEVVHVQISLGLTSPRFLYLLSMLCARARIPLLATLHDRDGGSRARHWAFRRTLLALRGADLVVHEPDQRAELDHPRVHVIPHGIWSIPERSSERARRELGLPIAGRIVSHFGFLHPDKGIEEVLRAIAELRAHGFPDLTYRVCGGTFPTAASRDYLRRLQAEVRALDLQDAVHLTGEFLSEERTTLELQAADLLVLNYRTGNNQGASGAGRRALAVGRALAVSRAPIFDDMRGAVHTLERPLTEEIGELLAQPEQRQRLIEKCRAYREERSWARIAAAHARLYRELRARGTAPELSATNSSVI